MAEIKTKHSVDNKKDVYTMHNNKIVSGKVYKIETVTTKDSQTIVNSIHIDGSASNVIVRYDNDTFSTKEELLASL